MHKLQELLIEHIQHGGLSSFFSNPKNTWLIVSGGYEEQLTAYLYHSVGGAGLTNLLYETCHTDNRGNRIIGDNVSERPDMIITGEVGQTDNRLVVAKIRSGKVIKYTNIPIIDFVQLGHDFANQVNCHLNKFNSEYEKLKGSLRVANAMANGLLHIQIVTEYIHISLEYDRYRNNRGQVSIGNNWIARINEQFNSSGFQCADTKTYTIKLKCGLEINVHILFAFRNFT